MSSEHAHSAPPLPNAPSAPTGPSALPSASGALPWGLGFLALIPFPLVPQLLSAIVMAAVGSSRRRWSGHIGEHGRVAAKWGLTYIAATVLLVGGAAVSGLVSNMVDDRGNPAEILALVLIGVWVLGLNLAHVICCIVGVVRANRGRPFDCKVAYPFLKA